MGEGFCNYARYNAMRFRGGDSTRNQASIVCSIPTINFVNENSTIDVVMHVSWSSEDVRSVNWATDLMLLSQHIRLMLSGVFAGYENLDANVFDNVNAAGIEDTAKSSSGLSTAGGVG